MTETKVITEEIDKPPKIELDDLAKYLQILDGRDPNHVQALAKFINMDNYEERSYFPNQITAFAVAQLLGLGEALFENDDSDPYTAVANAISRGLMGYKGFKSNQWVDITRQTTDLSSLGSAPDEVKRGFLARFSRGPKE